MVSNFTLMPNFKKKCKFARGDLEALITLFKEIDPLENVPISLEKLNTTVVWYLESKQATVLR
jgi:hypothetical protein